jgi:hypothetical protein
VLLRRLEERYQRCDIIGRENQCDQSSEHLAYIGSVLDVFKEMSSMEKRGEEGEVGMIVEGCEEVNPCLLLPGDYVAQPIRTTKRKWVMKKYQACLRADHYRTT